MTNSESSQQSLSLTVEQALHKAIAHHQADHLQDAERLYCAILKAQPNHPDANHNLGVLAIQAKQPAAALSKFKAALEANPSQGQYWLSYIDALIQTGQTEIARQILEQGQKRGLQGDAVKKLVCRLKSSLPVNNQEKALHHVFSDESTPDSLSGNNPSHQEMNAVVELFSSGRYEEVVTLSHDLTVRFPLHGLGWKLLGSVFGRMGRSADALAPMKRAVELTPHEASVHNNLGNIFRDLGLLDEAETSFRHALRITPNLAATHYNLGNILKDFGRLGEAEVCFIHALKIKPDYADAHNNLGNILNKFGRLGEAEASFKRALEIKSDYSDAYFNLGNTLKDLGRLDEAEVCFRRALEINPNDRIFHCGMGNLLSIVGRLDDAAEHFKYCLQIDPEDSSGVRLLLARLGVEPMPARASGSQLDKLYVERSQSWDNSNSYRGHELVAQAFKMQMRNSKSDILDAGCGTGLVGALIRGLANKLDGIDMSKAMLEKAKEKGIYDQIHQGDLVLFMLNHSNSYDAVTCAATLIHFGDLTSAFEAAAASLRDDGIFILTLFQNDGELSNQEVVVAQHNDLAGGGCFAHSSGYVRSLAEATGFIVEILDSEVHEYDKKGIPILGLIVALRRRFRSDQIIG
jgi:predicted TPR repeat methyltransferase/cytochrome c-type biogenesis protein CcmH/NrfG